MEALELILELRHVVGGIHKSFSVEPVWIYDGVENQGVLMVVVPVLVACMPVTVEMTPPVVAYYKHRDMG